MEGADMAKDVDLITQQKPHLLVKNEECQMWKAYKLVTDGKSSIRKAARIHEVAESTLRTRLKNPQLFERNKLGHPLLLGKSEEDEIAKHLREMTELGQRYSRSQALEVAAKVAKVSGIDKLPKKDWYYGFLKRYPDLATKRMKRNMPMLTDIKIKNIKKYFKEFKAFLEEHDLKDKAENIWNIELIGLALDKSPDEAEGTKSFSVDPGNSVTASILMAGNAQGEVLPPYVIYKEKCLTKKLTTGCITQSQFAVSRSGLPSSLTLGNFMEKLFIPNVDVRPIVILYDGNASFVTQSMIQKAQKKGIYFFVLPPQLSPQPTLADSGIFKQFKSSVMASCGKLVKEYGIVEKFNIPHLIAESFEASATVENLTNAYRMSGLVPFNPSIVLSKESSKPIDDHKGLRDSKTSKKDKREKLKISLKDCELGMKLKKRSIKADEIILRKRRKGLSRLDMLRPIQSVCAEPLQNDTRLLLNTEGKDSEMIYRSVNALGQGESEGKQTNEDIHSQD